MRWDALERDTDMVLRGSEGFPWALENTGQSWLKIHHSWWKNKIEEFYGKILSLSPTNTAEFF